jgi:glutamyl-tRNA reductase
MELFSENSATVDKIRNQFENDLVNYLNEVDKMETSVTNLFEKFFNDLRSLSLASAVIVDSSSQVVQVRLRDLQHNLAKIVEIRRLLDEFSNKTQQVVCSDEESIPEGNEKKD